MANEGKGYIREGIMRRPFVYTGVEGMSIFGLGSHRKSLFPAKINHSSVELYLQQHGEQSRSVKSEKIQRGKDGKLQRRTNRRSGSCRPLLVQKTHLQHKMTGILQKVFEQRKAFFGIGL